MRAALLAGPIAATAMEPAAEAEEPERASPPSGTIEQLRGAVAAASPTRGVALDVIRDWP